MCMAWTLSGVFHVAALTCNAPAMAFAPAPSCAAAALARLTSLDQVAWTTPMMTRGTTRCWKMAPRYP